MRKLERLSAIEICTHQLLSIDFDSCDIINDMIKTCYDNPQLYPTIEMDISGKKVKMWFVGYKSTGIPVFMTKHGICVTGEKKRVKDISTIIWRLKLERD